MFNSYHIHGMHFTILSSPQIYNEVSIFSIMKSMLQIYSVVVYWVFFLLLFVKCKISCGMYHKLTKCVQKVVYSSRQWACFIIVMKFYLDAKRILIAPSQHPQYLLWVLCCVMHFSCFNDGAFMRSHNLLFLFFYLFYKYWLAMQFYEQENIHSHTHTQWESEKRPFDES